MDYVIIEICITCKGIIDGENLVLEPNEHYCQCDWWSDTDPDNSGAAGPEQREINK